MDAGLKPEKLNLEARTPEAKEIFKYWLRCFEAYLDSSEIPILGPRKQRLLHAQVSHRISTTLEKAATYEEAVELLRKRFVKPINEVHARYLLSTCRQRSGESLDEFVEKLTTLARDCDHQDVTG
ncbi:hypothetical protein scyTo_0025626, partial [Scyliorhinus torazame]|nr:hypothetical protein [Scyliorhinus torazame]